MKKLLFLLLSVILLTSCTTKEQKTTNDVISIEEKTQDSIKLVTQKRIKDSLKTIELEKFKKSIKIIKYYTSEPNSAGGVDCNIIWKNLSEKTIKYVKFTVTPYNRVNDKVSSKYGDDSEILSVTGPIKQNQVEGHGTYWDCVWYNSTISYMKINQIEIFYMDGSSISTSDINVINKLGYIRK